jgi:hypothetical protein
LIFFAPKGEHRLSRRKGLFKKITPHFFEKMQLALAGGTERLCYTVGRKKEALHSTVNMFCEGLFKCVGYTSDVMQE